MMMFIHSKIILQYVFIVTSEKTRCIKYTKVIKYNIQFIVIISIYIYSLETSDHVLIEYLLHKVTK